MTPTDLRKLADGYNVTPGMTFSRQIREACRQAADEIERLRLGLEIIASDPWPCVNALQAIARRYLEEGGP